MQTGNQKQKRIPDSQQPFPILDAPQRRDPSSGPLAHLSHSVQLACPRGIQREGWPPSEKLQGDIFCRALQVPSAPALWVRESSKAQLLPSTLDGTCFGLWL